MNLGALNCHGSPKGEHHIDKIGWLPLRDSICVSRHRQGEEFTLQL
jgi:hypothetical protein